MDVYLKNLLLQTVQNTSKQFIFPPKKLKVGDKFIQEAPLSIPLGTIKFDFLIKTHYKLLSITEGKANFDIIQEFVLTTVIEDKDFKATGKGKGAMVYDIANSYPVVFNTLTDMDMSFKVEGLTVDMTSKITTDQKTAVSKNQ